MSPHDSSSGISTNENSTANAAASSPSTSSIPLSVSCEDEDENNENIFTSNRNEKNVEPSRKTNKKKHSSWKERLVIHLRHVLTGKRNKQVATTILLSISAYAFCKEYQRRRRRRQPPNDALKSKSRQSKTTTTMTTFWPTALLALFYPRSSPNHPNDASYQSAVEVSLSLLKAMATNGQIRRALVGPNDIYFLGKEPATMTTATTADSTSSTTTTNWKRSMLPKNSPTITNEILDVLMNGGCTDVSALPDTLWQKIGPALLTALPFVYLALVYKILKNANGNDMSNKILSGKDNNNDHQKTKFSDVAGMSQSIMLDMQDIVSYLQDPVSYNALGAKPPKGILFHGPPGNGKTLLAKAIAGETNCDAFVAANGSEFCEMYVGRGASRVRSIFQNARNTAKRRHYFKSSSSLLSSWLPLVSSSWSSFSSKQPSSSKERPATAILFIDELDALAKKRSYDALTNNDERDQTLNQLLTEMDGFNTNNNHNDDDDVIVIVIAATNREDVLDPAILRRFDRRMHISYPEKKGRQDIMKIHASKLPACNIDSINWELLASEQNTGGFSGSDLRALVNDAALLAVREKSTTVTQTHYKHAIQRLRAMKNVTRTATNRYSTASNQPPLWYPMGNQR